MNPHAEQSRLLNNLASYGTVLEVDPTQAAMRLQIGDNQTDWTPIPAMAAGNIKIWRCPTVGEQFLLVAPSGELANAQAVCARYSDHFAAPSLDPDVLYIQLSEQHFISINTTTGAITVKASLLTLDIDDVSITGKLLVKGLIQSMTDVWAKALSLLTHKHGGVQNGGGVSGVGQ